MKRAIVIACLTAWSCGSRRQPSAGASPSAATSEQPGWHRGVCGVEGWCWAYPRPMAAKLNRLWGAGPRDVWAVGDGGMILHFDGDRWSLVPSGTEDELVAIGGRGAGDAWAIGRNRTLLRLRGTTWRRLMAVSDSLHRTWLAEEDGATPDAARPMPDAEQLFAATVEAAALRPPEEGEFNDLAVLSNGEAWVVGGFQKQSLAGESTGYAGIIGHFDGKLWAFERDSSCGPFASVWGASPNDVWMDGDAAHWNGRYLVLNPKEKPGPIVGRHGLASGWRLERSGGPSQVGWLRHAKFAPEAKTVVHARDFWAFGESDVWAIDADGGLAHFDGTAWNNADEQVAITGVAARARDDVWAIGSSVDGRRGAHAPVLMHFDGRAWTISRIPSRFDEKPIAIALGPKPPVASGTTEDVWVMMNELQRFDGQRWSHVATLPEGYTERAALLVRAPDDIWIGGAGILLHGDGKAFETHKIDFTITALWMNGAQLWAGRSLHRWDGKQMIQPPELATAGVGGKRLEYAAGSAHDGEVWLAADKRILRLRGGALEGVVEFPALLKGRYGYETSIWIDPTGDVWAGGAHIVRGHGGRWTMEDDAGAAGVQDIGGVAGLAWARTERGILLRPLP